MAVQLQRNYGDHHSIKKAAIVAVWSAGSAKWGQPPEGGAAVSPIELADADAPHRALREYRAALAAAGAGGLLVVSGRDNTEAFGSAEALEEIGAGGEEGAGGAVELHVAFDPHVGGRLQREVLGPEAAAAAGDRPRRAPETVCPRPSAIYVPAPPHARPAWWQGRRSGAGSIGSSRPAL